MNKIKILHLEDNPDDSELVIYEFKSCGYDIDYVRVDCEKDFIVQLEHNRFDVILADYNLPTFDGISALRICSENYPETPFIIVSGTLGEEIAVKILKYGAADYLLKQNLRRLVVAVEHAMDETVLKQEKLKAEKELIVSEERFRTITESSADAIFLFALDGRLVFTNKKVTELLKFSQEEMLLKTITDLVPETQVERFSTLLNHLLNEGKAYGELEILKKDGAVVPVDLNAVVLPDKLLYASCRDITERKQAVMEIETAAQRWASTFDAISDIVCIVSNDHKLLAMNRAGYEQPNFPIEQIIDKYCNEFIHKTCNPLKNWSEKAREETGESTSFEYEGKYYFLQIWPIPSHDGKVDSFVQIIKDITEKKLAEKILNENEEKYRSIFENTQDVFYQIDINGNIIEISPSITRLSGYNREELIGNPSTLFYYFPEERDLLLEELNRTKEVWDYEIRLRTKDERIKYTSINAHLMFNSEGNQIGIEGSMRDIDVRKQFEIKLKEAKEKAEESDRLKTAFLHNISHEIRTPMNAIIGFSTLLGLPDTTSQDQMSYIQLIKDGSNQLLSIINDIVDISSIEANIIKKNDAPVNLNRILDSLYSQFQLKTYENGNTLKISPGLSDERATIQTDSTKLIQILSNLINNALKFTRKGQVEFGYRLRESIIEFFVSDTGIGISSKHHSRIFENFYQVETELSRQYGGTGLGLAISKAYSELLGGRIWVTSEPGKGSSFYFNLPYSETQIETPLETGTREVINFTFTYPVTILVAEDDDQNFNLIAHQLSDPSVNVVRANNGKEALESCTQINFDLVLMDLKMPVMDGYTAAEKLKVLRPGLPVIAQTAFVTDREKALNSGCIDFLNKPFKKDELLSVIKKHIRYKDNQNM
jgi:PAS domain S-box-containing protein